MRERSNRAVSKTVVLQSTGGSNPPLSVPGIQNRIITGTFCCLSNLIRQRIIFGKMSEWSMVQSWKGCVPKGTGGSNPPLSVTAYTQSTRPFRRVQVLCKKLPSNPVRFGRKQRQMDNFCAVDYLGSSERFFLFCRLFRVIKKKVYYATH